MICGYFQIIACAILAVVAADKLTGNEQVPILRNDVVVNPDGSYQYAYETGNGIVAESQGFLKNIDKDTDAQVSWGQSWRFWGILRVIELSDKMANVTDKTFELLSNAILLHFLIIFPQYLRLYCVYFVHFDLK